MNRRLPDALTAVGSGLALLGTVHAAWNVHRLRRPGPPQAHCAAGLPAAALLIPARDEAANIAECVRAARAQPVIDIVVLDDGSRDQTAALARAAGGDDARVRVITGAPPPTGWLGKPHACAQAAAVADPRAEVLIFCDADVRLAPYAVRAAAEMLAAGTSDGAGLDLVSPHPRQLALSVTERLVQPLLAWSWLTTLPLRVAERSPRPALSAANGQFLVVRRAAYWRAGGHAAIRDQVLDDLALARAIKRVGGRVAMIDGSELARVRMYRGWRELREGYGKSLWAAFGSPAGAAAALGGLTISYLVPPLAALRGSWVGLGGYLAAVAGRMITARASGDRSWPDAFAHPGSVALAGYLTLRSVHRHRRGELRWKGRPVTVIKAARE